MFNLEQSIVEWRRQMLAAGINKPSLVEELEGHLREEIERLMKSGVTTENALETAVEHIGNAILLKKEFKKISGSFAWLERLMIAIAAVFFSFIVFLSGATVVLCFTSPGDRVTAAMAMACTILVAFGWKYAVPFLPVISGTRKRLAVALACIVSGFIAGPGLYCNLVLPYFVHDLNIFVPPPASIFWAAFIVAVFSSLGVGLCLGEKEREIRGMKKSA
jgi:hypothetical protein